MTEAIAPVGSKVPNQTLVALTSTDLAPVQAQLEGWCKAKILSLSQDLREQRQNARQATARHWKRSGWHRAAAKTKAQMIYYAKIAAAVRAGYLIVPNFNISVIAVRTSRSAPRNERAVEIATPDTLPPKHGRYVSNTLIGYTDREKYKDRDGRDQTREWFVPTDFDTQLNFPVQLVKPIVLQATDRALSQKLFDRIGVVTGSRRSDPIVMGQILYPGQRSWDKRRNPRCVSFFIAWWLDTNDL